MPNVATPPPAAASTAPSDTAPAAGRFLDISNPATGEPVGRVPATPREAVAGVVERAREAARPWGEAPWSERAAVLRRFHDAVLAAADEILDTVQRESGKTRRDAALEVATVAGTARYYLAHGEGHLRGRRHQPAVPGLTSARTVHKPLGAVGIISPWNFPFLLAVGDAVPALLAGNAVVVKPSELTPLSAELARRLLVESGLDPALFSLVHGDGPTIGAELVEQADYIGFTGSTRVGREIAAAAGRRLIPSSLELGGKNPMLVLEDAPIDDAVEGLVTGAFANSGQTCLNVERVLVDRRIHDRFVEAAVERVGKLSLGWSLGWGDDVGSLVSREHADKVMEHVEDARAKGATVLAGGRRRSDLGPAFVEPTLLAGVTGEMLAGREETFGPVVSIEPFDSVDEALRRANDTCYGLNGSVWGGDGAFAVARRLETGSANVNSTLLIYHSFDVPMGGAKASGLGRRHGAHGIRRYTEEQAVVGSFSTGGGYEAIVGHLTSRRRARALLGAFRLWRHLPLVR